MHNGCLGKDMGVSRRGVIILNALKHIRAFMRPGAPSRLPPIPATLKDSLFTLFGISSAQAIDLAVLTSVQHTSHKVYYVNS